MSRVCYARARTCLSARAAQNAAEFGAVANRGHVRSKLHKNAAIAASRAYSRRPALSLFAAVHAVPVDTSDMCEMWASSGECDANPDHTRQNCAASRAGQGQARRPRLADEARVRGLRAAGRAAQPGVHAVDAAPNATRRRRTGCGSTHCVASSGLLGKCAEELARMAAECNTSCTVVAARARRAAGGASASATSCAARRSTGPRLRGDAAAGERTQTSRMADRCRRAPPPTSTGCSRRRTPSTARSTRCSSTCRRPRRAAPNAAGSTAGRATTRTS